MRSYRYQRSCCDAGLGGILPAAIDGIAYGARVPFTRTVVSITPQPYPKPNIDVDDFTASNVTLLSSTGFVTVTDRVTQTTAKVCQGRGGMVTA